jgi:hypothetical protein
MTRPGRPLRSGVEGRTAFERPADQPSSGRSLPGGDDRYDALTALLPQLGCTRRGNYWTCPHCRGEKHTLHVIRHRAISGAVTLNCPKCADLSLVLKALGDWNKRVRDTCPELV